MNKYVMAFGAHSDDIDLRAGGTVAKYVDEGYRLVYVVVTTSASGIYGLSPKEAIKIRRKEAKNAAWCYKTRPLFLNFEQAKEKDRLFKGKNPITSEDKGSVGVISDLILKYKPEIIFTHTPDDLHEDHYFTSRLIYKGYLEAKKKLNNLKLWLWEGGSRGSILGFVPNKFVDIKKYISVKDKAIKMHLSQCKRAEWMRVHAFESGKFWGAKCGMDFAEGFREI